VWLEWQDVVAGHLTVKTNQIVAIHVACSPVGWLVCEWLATLFICRLWEARLTMRLPPISIRNLYANVCMYIRRWLQHAGHGCIHNWLSWLPGSQHCRLFIGVCAPAMSALVVAIIEFYGRLFLLPSTTHPPYHPFDAPPHTAANLWHKSKLTQGVGGGDGAKALCPTGVI